MVASQVYFLKADIVLKLSCFSRRSGTGDRPYLNKYLDIMKTKTPNPVPLTQRATKDL
ncbi:MAG: hypothetical protein AAF327_22070 [Cyanobacteria bacterium P01_A01_bin.37]